MDRKKDRHHSNRHRSSSGRDSERRSHHNSFHQHHHDEYQRHSHQAGAPHRSTQENQFTEQYHQIPPFELDHYQRVHRPAYIVNHQQQDMFANQDIPNQGYQDHHPSMAPVNQSMGQNFMDIPNSTCFNAAPGTAATSMTTAQTISALALQRLKLPQDMIEQSGIIPNNPYYELPAGLMAPLVPASRRVYKPLNPKELRLPFPKFPDENFLYMIDSYYKTDDERRDNDGWDREFIDTYLKQKEALSAMEAEMT